MYLDRFQDSILISIQYIGLTCDEQPKNTNTEGHCAGPPTDFIRTDLHTTLKVARMRQRDACPAAKTHVSFFSILSPTATVSNSNDSRRKRMGKLH